MKGYQILNGDTFEGWKSNIFFNTKEYLTLHGESFFWFKLFSGETLLAQIIFTIHDDKALSPFRAPYGGLEIIEKLHITEEVMCSFMEEVFFSLKTKQVKNIKISSLPNFYFNLSVVFKKISHKEEIVDTTFYYPTEKKDGYNTTKRNIVNQLKRKNYYCSELTELEEAYQIIEQQYRVKDYPLTMSLSEIKTSFVRFPKKYQLLGCYNNENVLCSVLFLVKVSDHLQYVMYNGTIDSFTKESPLVLLYDYMICIAREEGVKYIDYGIASVGGVLNEGLAFFKKSMGGVESQKVIYTYVIEI